MNQPNPGSFDPQAFDASELANPALDQNILAQLATYRPELRPAIAQHPNCYPGLRDWIAQQAAQTPSTGAADPGTAQPAADAGQPGTRPQGWPAQGQASAQSAHSAASASQQDSPYAASAQQPGNAASAPEGAAQQPGGAQYPASDQAPGSPQNTPAGQPDGSAQQFTEGAKQMVSGATQAFQGALGAQAKATGPAKLLGWIPIALAGFSVLAIIATFFPAITVNIGKVSGVDLGSLGGKHSYGFYGAAAGHEGVYLLILFLLTAAAAVLVFTKSDLLWARIVAGVLGIVAAIFGMIDGFGTTSKVNKYDDLISGAGSWLGDGGGSSIKAGAGAILLGIFSILVILAALAILVPPNKITAAGRTAGRQGGGQPGQQWNAYPQQGQPQQPQWNGGQQYGQPQQGGQQYGQPQWTSQPQQPGQPDQSQWNQPQQGQPSQQQPQWNPGQQTGQTQPGQQNPGQQNPGRHHPEQTEQPRESPEDLRQ